MAFDVVGTALDLIGSYGLAAIVVLLVLDAAMLLPVFPGEVVLVMAVAAYAKDYPSLLFLIGLTTAASLLGSLLLYGIMRGGGRRLVERYPRLFMMPRRRRERLEKAFERPAGQSLVLFLRLVPLTRVLVNIPAGLAKMRVVRFLVLSGIGLLLYHAGFLWFAYEVRRPGSALATQRQRFQDAYASPAMDVVAANAIVSVLVVLAIGAVASVRASRAILRDPEESTGSLLGWLATMGLLLGGLVVGVATYLDPVQVVALARLGGVDVEAAAASVRLSTLGFLWGAAGLMVLVGAVLRALTTRAHAHRKSHRRSQKEQTPADPWPRGPDDPRDPRDPARPRRRVAPLGAAAPATPSGRAPLPWPDRDDMADFTPPSPPKPAAPPPKAEPKAPPLARRPGEPPT